MSFAPKQFIRSVDFLSTENATNTSTGSVNIYGGMSVSKDSYLTNMIVVGNSTVTNLTITGNLRTTTGNTLTSSQWTSIDSNTDIYFGTSANSFVGIGTTTPGFNLDISGGSRITGGLTVGNLNVNTGATITNILNTTICTSTLMATGSTIATLRTTSTTTGVLIATTGITTGTLNATGTINTTNVTSTNIVATNVSSSNLLVSGTINSGDVTVGNINFTGSLFQNGSAYLGSQWTTTAGNTLSYTSGNISVNLGFTSSFNSNTIGNIFTTGGNVGIATANPVHVLDVNGTTRINNINATSMGTLIIAGPGSSDYIPSTATSGQLASFYGPGGAGIYSNIDLSTFIPSSSSSSLPTVRFSMLDLGSNISNFNILTRNSGVTGTMASRIFIDGSGNIGISTTVPTNYLQVANIMLLASTGTLTCTGDIYAFGTISDQRLKTNIVNINTESALNTVKKLRPVTFNWKDDIFYEQRRGQDDSGFIAQEVDLLIPHAVGEYTEIEHGQTYKNMRHERIIPYLTATIQKLIERVEQNETDIAYLKNIF